MPRQPARSYSEIFNRLKDEELFDENGVLYKKLYTRPSDGQQPWSIWAGDLKPMTDHGLYIYVLNDRKGIQTHLRNHQSSSSPASVQNAEYNSGVESSPPPSKNSSLDEIPTLHDQSQDDILPTAPDECDILLRMKTNIAYTSQLQKIAIDPFSLTVYSPDQINIYKNLVKTNFHVRVAVLQEVISGIQIRSHRTSLNNSVLISSVYEKHVIFLGHNIGQNLRADTAARFVEGFMTFEDNTPLPEVLCLTYNIDLLHEICSVLNECSAVDYLDQCLVFIETREKNERASSEDDLLKSPALPPVKLVVDLITVLLRIDRSDILSKKTRVVKRFYMECVILLSLKKSLNEFKNSVQSVLIVLLSSFEDDNVIQNRTSLEHEFNIYGTAPIYEVFADYSSNDNFVKALSITESKKLPVSDYIKDMELKILQNTSKTPNSYYSFNWYQEEFGSLLSIFICWTNILVNQTDKFDSVSNVSAQHFNFISSKADDGLKFTDLLLQLILETTDSVNIGRSKMNNRKKRKDMNEVGLRYLKKSKYEENWGGRNVCYKEPADPFTEKDPCVDDMKDTKDDCDLFNSLEVNDSVNLNHPNHEDKNQVGEMHASRLEDPMGSVLQDEELEPQKEFSSMSEDLNHHFIPAANSSVTDLQNNFEFAVDHTSHIDADMKAISVTERFEPEKNHRNEFEVVFDDLLENDADTKDISVTEELNNPPVTVINLVPSNTSPSVSIYDVFLEHDYSARSGDLHTSDSTQFPNFLNEDNKVTDSLDTSDKLNSSEDQVDMHYVTVVVPYDRKVEDLNEIQPRKYIAPCPDMKIRHDQTVKNSKKDSLIRNAGVLCPRKIQGRTYSFSDSSKFDVLAELLSFGYKNFASFKQFCDGQKDYCTKSCVNNCIIVIAMQFCKSGSVTTLQKSRGNFLYQSAHVDDTLAKISIEDSFDIWCTKVLKLHPSYSVISSCKKCKNSEILHQCVVNLEVDESQDLKNLDALFRTHITNFRLQKKCKTCESLDQESSFVWSSYLLFNVGLNDVDFDFDKLPHYLDISTVPGDVHSFSMVGVICREHDGRLITYCRNLQGFYTKRDSIKNKIKCCRSTNTNIVSIMYLKIK